MVSRFNTRYDGELREPLIWRQGSQVSMRMARQDEALARDGVSREDPCSALKGVSRP